MAFLGALASGLLGSAAAGAAGAGGNQPASSAPITIQIHNTLKQVHGDIGLRVDAAGGHAHSTGTGTGGAAGAGAQSSSASKAAADAKSDAQSAADAKADAQATADAKAVADALSALQAGGNGKSKPKGSSSDAAAAGAGPGKGATGTGTSTAAAAEGETAAASDSETLEKLGNFTVLLMKRIKQLEEQAAAVAPVGTIVAWHRSAAINMSTQLPSGWVACNGQRIQIETKLFDPIGKPVVLTRDFDVPNLNGANDQPSRFLRGTTGQTGVEQGDSIRSHNHGGATQAATARVVDQSSGNQLCRVQMFHQPPANIDVWRASWGAQNPPNGNPHGVHGWAVAEAHTHPIALEGGVETRPVNAAFMWIMRVF